MADDKTICPLRYLTNTFGGKWTLSIICVLSNQKPQLLTAAAEWAVKELGFENLEAYCSKCVKIS